MKTIGSLSLIGLCVLLVSSVCGAATNAYDHIPLQDHITVIRVSFVATNEQIGTNLSLSFSVTDAKTIERISSLLKAVALEKDAKVEPSQRWSQRWRLVMASGAASGELDLGSIAVPRTVVVDIVDDAIFDHTGTPMHVSGDGQVRAIREFLETVLPTRVRRPHTQ